uniref:Separase n=1 Tax=Parascaris univalens TaxID=6257 RepID=A0A915CKH1_PARUN
VLQCYELAVTGILRECEGIIVSLWRQSLRLGSLPRTVVVVNFLMMLVLMSSYMRNREQTLRLVYAAILNVSFSFRRFCFHQKRFENILNGRIGEREEVIEEHMRNHFLSEFACEFLRFSPIFMSIPLWRKFQRICGNLGGVVYDFRTGRPPVIQKWRNLYSRLKSVGKRQNSTMESC